MVYANLKNRSTYRSHLSKHLSYEKLSKDEEYLLIEEWQKKTNKKALMKIISSHQRLLNKIARGYSGYGIKMDDLISEGYVGLIQAANKFTHEQGFRFSTYATRTIKNVLQRLVMKLSSAISVKPDNDNRKLFFQLKRVKAEINPESDKAQSKNIEKNDLAKIEELLKVSQDKIKAINKRIYFGDVSLNQRFGTDENSAEFQETIKSDIDVEKEVLEKDDVSKKLILLKKSLEILSKKQYEIFKARRLVDTPKKLSDLASEYNISKERIRQIEHEAFLKITKNIKLLFFKNSSNSYCFVCILF